MIANINKPTMVINTKPPKMIERTNIPSPKRIPKARMIKSIGDIFYSGVYLILHRRPLNFISFR